MSPLGMARLDGDRFAKCVALALRGATEGERSAALAAAHRVAARHGLTLVEMMARLAPEPAPPPPPPRGPAFGPPAPRASWMRPKPATLAEAIASRLEHETWLRVLNRTEAQRGVRRPRPKDRPIRPSAARPAGPAAVTASPP